MSDLMVDALSQQLTFEPVPANQVVEGSPLTGLFEVDTSPAGQWGVWEMTPGAMRDVEDDEYCVVIAGRGSVERQVMGEQVIHELSPGVVLRLLEGEHTIWRVSESLRKVYWIPQS
jgi:uncharacterized cupin superfamily protein